MSDTYPNICRIEEAPNVSWSHRIHLRRVGNAIARRTGLFCSFNKVNNSLLFHQGPEPFGGPLSLPVFHPDRHERRYSDPDIDLAVETVGICRVGRKAKDVWAAKQKQRDAWEKKSATDKYLDDVRPGATDYARYLDQRRRGVGKLISA